jgi:hypothetical protein
VLIETKEREDEVMKRWTITLLAVMFAMGMPMAAMAMSHESHEGHDHGKSEEMMHKGHEMEGHGDMKHADQGGLMKIGESSAKGVKAIAKVKTYDAETVASMSKMGMDGTHHLMLFFTDEASGAEIVKGTVAIKVKGPGDSKAKAVKLMQMGSGFGADVAMTEKGHYDLEVGTKLEDGKKRQFKFHQMVD